MNHRDVAIWSGPLVFLLILFFFNPEGLSPEAKAVLACTAWVAIWWISEAIPIAVTALLPIILFPLTGAVTLANTTAQFGHKYVFLYLGGFMIAIAIEKWGLHRRIALQVIHLIGSDVRRIILGFMAATAFISMWISNTATAVMMMPIGMAIINQLQDNPATKEDENLLFGKALMLGIAYAASIGGMATLIGTPPNLVLAGVVEENYGIQLTFSRWLIFGLPLSLFLLFLCWYYLTRIGFRFTSDAFPGGKVEVHRLLMQLGGMKIEEKRVLVVFLITASLWIGQSFLQKWITSMDDTVIAMFGAFLLFLLPSTSKGVRLLNWEEAVKLPWGIILLFGGGMALAEGFSSTGLAAWIGAHMIALQGLPLFLLLLLLVASVNFLTEVTSNLATTAMLLPVLAPMALSLDLHPFILMVSATVAASCAFMLPVATPPNAVVFGSGYLRIPDMIRAGLWMNLISIILVTLMVYFILPMIWGFDPLVFPTVWK